jgi:hypothetical protein
MDMPDDVKNVREFMTPEQVKMYNTFAVADGPLYRTGYFPPGTPTEYRDIISNAMAEAVKDPEFRAGFKKVTGREPDQFISGADLDKIAADVKLEDFDAVFRQYLPGYKSPL